ncbi:hypothetical protein ACFLT8_02265 [Chloroflexota bacterium]
MKAWETHEVELIWIKEHSDSPYNVRCHHLANKATLRPSLPVDYGYEKPPHRLL